MASPYSRNELSTVRELQRFLDAAIHDIRSPLRCISISASLLSKDWQGRLDERANEQLKSILSGASRIDNLAKSLSDYSMALLGDSSSCVVLPVELALRTAMSALEKQIAETKATIHSEALPQLGANHEQLNVLFRCLLSNSIEYRGDDPPRIDVNATQYGEDWRFALRDNGKGIASRYQRKVFEPFQRLQAGARGVGLGLATCKKIVEAHGGGIWLESEEGRGTTVIFTLPADR
jgi:light-regulated signal transduction histidine kinase (bacteriophytochrome)